MSQNLSCTNYFQFKPGSLRVEQTSPLSDRAETDGAETVADGEVTDDDDPKAGAAPGLHQDEGGTTEAKAQEEQQPDNPVQHKESVQRQEDVAVPEAGAAG